MICADLLRAVLATVLVFVGDNVAAIYVIAFVLSMGGVLFDPAANSVLPTLVEDNELVAANSGIWTSAVLSQIALAPLAGLLYTALGPSPAFGINAASFLISAVVLTRLRLPAIPASTSRHGFFANALAGVRLLAGDRLLRALGAGQLLAALSAGATSALLVVLARDHLALPPTGYGLLLGAIGVGAATGPLLLTGSSPTPADRSSSSGPMSSADSSTSSSPRSPPYPSPCWRWPPTASVLPLEL